MNARILLIEDDSATMELMLYLLKRFGFQPIIAFNGEDGLNLARSTAPQLILCDVNMPGICGAAFVRELQRLPELQHVPVVAVTAMVMEGEREGLLRLGFNGYIPEPIDADLLLAQITVFPPCVSGFFQLILLQRGDTALFVTSCTIAQPTCNLV